MQALLAMEPADLGKLADTLEGEELAELLDLLERAVGGESLYDFICRVCPNEPPPRHLLPLLRAVEWARLLPLRLCISMPPGHAKTTTLLRAIIWWLQRSPADTCAYVSHSDRFASGKSRTARDLAASVGIVPAKDADTLAEWHVAAGGGLIAAGAKGSLTGKRVPGLLIYDDPYKNREEADSPVIREKVWAHFREAAFTRLQGGSIIVLHTRWHEDDLIGRIVRELNWTWINIEAIAEPANDNADILGRSKGEAAWPDQYPVKKCEGPCGHAGHLEESRGVLGSWSFEALFQGHPSPMEGGLFKREWFRYVDELPANLDGPRARGWDLASSTAETADYTATTRERLTPVRDEKRKEIGKVLYIDHARAFRGSPATVEAEMKALHNSDPKDVVWSIPEDPGGAGEIAAFALKKQLKGRTVISSKETGSKVHRLLPIAALAEGGYERGDGTGIVLLRGEWNAALVDQLCTIPAAKHDDLGDATSRGYAALITQPDRKVGGRASAQFGG